jgi:hypothetical protein
MISLEPAPGTADRCRTHASRLAAALGLGLLVPVLGSACIRAGFEQASVPVSDRTSALPLPPTWMTDGLVGWWKMDESSGTLVVDASGSGNDGVLTGGQETGTAQAGSSTTSICDPANVGLSTVDDAYRDAALEITSGTMAGTRRLISAYAGGTRTFTLSPLLSADPTGSTFVVRHQTAGKFGRALAFKGELTGTTAAFVEVPGSSTLTIASSVTVAVWVYRHATDAGDSVLIQSRRPGYSDGNFGLRSSSFPLYVDDLGHPSGYLTLFFPAPASESWHHIVGTYDGHWQRVFIDGEETGAAERVGQHTIDNSGASLTMGANMNFGTQTYSLNGLLDDVRIYNRALSAVEVRTLYAGSPAPVGWWKLDEDSGTTARDSSGNDNDGNFMAGGGNWVDGNIGNGIEFTGAPGRVEAGVGSAAMDIVGPLTIETWVKPDVLPPDRGAHQNVVGKGSDSDNFWNIGIDSWDGDTKGFYFSVRVDGNWLLARANATASNHVGRWAFVAGVYDRHNLTVYVDGVAGGPQAYAGLLPASSSDPLSIGYPSFAGLAAPNAVIDDVRIYNYARTQEQIAEDMDTQ